VKILNNIQLDITKILEGEEGKIPIGKAALALAMIADDSDDTLVELLNEKDLLAVITRAGGKGEEVKNKVLRNSLAAAVNSAVITDNIQDRRVLARCVERALAGLGGPMTSISGAGMKIGIVRDEAHLAVAIYGKIGIPGLNVDHEISGLGVHYYGLLGD
jgi:hypothetical protein